MTIDSASSLNDRRMISHRELFSVAWPYTVSMATGFIIQAVDSSMVAPFGDDALAAMTIATTAIFFPSALTMGLITSVQKRAAAHRAHADEALSTGLVIAAVLSVPCALAYYAFADAIASFYVRGPIARLAAEYLKLFAPAMVPFSLNHAFNGYWIGILKPKSRLAVTLAMTVVNCVVNVAAIPYLGVRGMAAGSVAAFSFGCALNWGLAYRRESFRWVRPRRRQIIEDTRIIAGVSLNQLSLGLMLNTAVFLVGLIGARALAVSNVIGVLSAPALYLGIGFGTATGTYLVKFLNARDVPNARVIAWRALAQVATISLGLSALLLIASGPLRHWYFRDPETCALSRTPFLMLAALYLADGVCCALQRFHFVTDGLRRSFLIMLGVQWLLFFPLAYVGITRWAWTYDTYLALHLAARALTAALLYFGWRKRLGTVAPGAASA